MGNNNFQAGSRVIRLRTYGRDGRPELGNGRLPANLSIDDLQNGAVVDSSDESAGVRSHGIGVASAAATEGSQAMAREHSNSHSGQRRNTVGRRHSPSAASEHPVPPLPNGHDADATMQQLTERFESIRGETEQIMSQMAKDADESKQQMAELIKERDEKRQALKEKEEASEKLKKEVNTSERSNRQAQNRKSQKEKALRDKKAEKTKMKDDMTRWQRDIQEMQKETASWQKEREKIAKSTEKKVEELKEILRKRQNSLNGMEEEIRVKGLQIKELEEERQMLPGVEDDEESKERDAAERQRDAQWDMKERELIARINSQSLVARSMGDDLQKANTLFAELSARHTSNPIMYQHANSSGVDFEPNGHGRAKSRRSRQRKSRTNTVSSPVPGYSNTDTTFPNASVYNNMANLTSPTYAAGPYFDMSATTGMSQLSETSGMSEADIRALTAGAPLSPTATSLLPSNIFADDEPPSPTAEGTRSFGPSLFPNIGLSMYDNEHQSPNSSSRSASLISSPRTSSHNLPLFPPIREPPNEGDRRSIHSPGGEFGVIGSPSTEPAQPVTGRRFGDLFNLSRQRGKTMDDGPALGTLKAGQSQSFPRQTEESESLVARNRRTSFSTGWGGLPFLNRSGTGNDVTEGNAPAPARNVARRRRAFNMFGSSDDPTAVYVDRDPSSPRPASIASSDLPRPSTDSGAFGWAAADPSVINRNSPLATNWSLGVAHPWSRNPSRRPSIQHGSSSALSIGIAADDDEFLPAETLQSSPPPVGVIGTRPQSSKSATPKLNPAAPTFKAMFSRASKTDKDKLEKSEKFRGKRGTESTDELHGPFSAEDMSPTESRKSRDTRDTRSIHTSASVTESHESLVLDRTLSNTASDPSGKDGKENSFQKLLRKGSSSKFSIGSFSRSKESSLFGGKKGSAPSSDRNASGDRSSSFGDMEESGEDGNVRIIDSVTSSPQIGGTPTGRDGRMSVNWGRFPFKKGKGGRSSMEAGEREKERASETEGTGDEGEN